MANYMTKKQAEQFFKECYPQFKEETPTTQRCMWNDFTDYLCKDGNISENQYNNWSHPRFIKR